MWCAVHDLGAYFNYPHTCSVHFPNRWTLSQLHRCSSSRALDRPSNAALNRNLRRLLSASLQNLPLPLPGSASTVHPSWHPLPTLQPDGSPASWRPHPSHLPGTADSPKLFSHTVTDIMSWFAPTKTLFTFGLILRRQLNPGQV